MRPLFLACLAVALVARTSAEAPATPDPAAETVNRIFAEALAHGQAYQNLRDLTTQCPGRLSGSPALERAVIWGQEALKAAGPDRIFTQPVMVPHWVRGAPESVSLAVPGGPIPLAALALGNSPSTPPGGITAEVIEVKSLKAVEELGRERVAGRIVFFNRPMDPTKALTMVAYGEAGDQRNQGPSFAARFGAVAALTRSLTLAHDDIPHAGNTSYQPAYPTIPAAALGVVSAEKLSAALAADPHTRVTMQLHSEKLSDAPSHNVVGEIRGSEFPNEYIVVGGHLDSWDVAPGAHDDGAGVVQAIEVLRLFRVLGLKPRHTIRCVMFVNEENGSAGARRYAEIARTEGRHVFAVETDNGGFAPAGFNFGSTQGDIHERAARWLPLFEPWGVWSFVKGAGGADVNPLMMQGVPVAGLMPNSQRYFDYHHTRIDSIEQVNPRELHLGAAALAALIWLVDQQGL